MEIVQIAAVVLFLSIAFITDIKFQIIPNWLTLSSITAAFIYHLSIGGGVGTAAAGAAAGFFPLLLLYLARGIGAGDVKLFAALGSWIGVWTVLQLMLYSILYAGAIGVCLIVINRAFGKRFAAGAVAMLGPASGGRKLQWLQWAESGKKFPFMLAVVPAAITVWSMMS
ncbi:A24 family peptidase [Paenibacillus luteus]|uniref:A24 family peptidase n=1 Tax=Paenibacillus luteus TaxID=2545753 RepID=UPI0013761CC7|nr:A24 family peptidase [Paenibacillus luteus]